MSSPVSTRVLGGSAQPVAARMQGACGRSRRAVSAMSPRRACAHLVEPGADVLERRGPQQRVEGVGQVEHRAAAAHHQREVVRHPPAQPRRARRTPPQSSNSQRGVGKRGRQSKCQGALLLQSPSPEAFPPFPRGTHLAVAEARAAPFISSARMCLIRSPVLICASRARKEAPCSRHLQDGGTSGTKHRALTRILPAALYLIPQQATSRPGAGRPGRQAPPHLDGALLLAHAVGGARVGALVLVRALELRQPACTITRTHATRKRPAPQRHRMARASAPFMSPPATRRVKRAPG